MEVFIQLYLFLFYLNIVQCDNIKSIDAYKNASVKTIGIKASSDLLKSPDLNNSTNVSNTTSSTISYYEEVSPISTENGEITYETYENVTEVNLDIENTTTIPETTIDYENVTISLLDNGGIATSAATPKRSRKKGKGLEKVHGNSNCACDITYASCDVLCCCDVDCPSDANEIFPYCLNKEERKTNLRYCDSVRNGNDQNSAFLDAEINQLFCIMKENSPEKTTSISVDMTSAHVVNELSQEYHTWKNHNFTVTNTTYESKLSYAYEDPIWMMKGNSILAVGMPSAFLTEYCSERLPLTFLKNRKSSCLTRLADLEMFNANTNIQDMCIMTSPALSNRSCIQDNQNTSACGCVPIQNFLCDHLECRKVGNSESLLSPKCNQTFCINMATSIKFTFYTNSSNIIEGQLYVYLSNMSSSFKYARQEFESVYFYRTNNVTSPRQLSGNPGYISGKPVLVSNVIQNNTEIQFEYYSTNESFPLRNILSYPKNVAGNCVLSNVTFVPINFGENVQSFCKYEFNVELNDDFNASIFCVAFQNDVLNFLQVTGIEKKLVSKYGNPYTETNNNWISFFHDDKIYDVEGQFNENTIYCKNFVRSVSYEFLFGRVDSGSGKKEATLLSAYLKKKSDDVIKFKIRNNKVSAILSVSSMFYDVTKVTNYEYVAEHKFYLHIPYDFFYPFTMNTVDMMHCNVSVFVLLLLINFVF